MKISVSIFFYFTILSLHKNPSLTVSSLTLSMLYAGMDEGVSRPMVVTPFWSREIFSRPLTLKLGVKTCEQWLLTLPVRLFQGVAVELVRLLKTSPWMLYSSSPKSASELLRARKELKMLI